MPAAIAASLLAALEQGAAPHDLGRALAYAAALRIARFGTANEFSDWDTALHGFTYANALHQLLGRVGEQEEAWPLALRGVLHGAMALWLSRYLNQPPARLPDARRDRLDELPDDPEALCENLLDAFDRQQQVNPAARLVARYLQLRLPTARLLGTLAHALLREDADFHTYQMFEAAVRQHHEWGDARRRPRHPDRARPLPRGALPDRARPLPDRDDRAPPASWRAHLRGRDGSLTPSRHPAPV